MLDDDSGLTGQFAGYPELFADLKARIRSAQVRAALSVNRELVLLYQQIGSAILVRQEEEYQTIKTRGEIDERFTVN